MKKGYGPVRRYNERRRTAEAYSVDIQSVNISFNSIWPNWIVTKCLV